jgi:hypothetical protein
LTVIVASGSHDYTEITQENSAIRKVGEDKIRGNKSKKEEGN